MIDNVNLKFHSTIFNVEFETHSFKTTDKQEILHLTSEITEAKKTNLLVILNSNDLN